MYQCEHTHNGNKARTVYLRLWFQRIHSIYLAPCFWAGREEEQYGGKASSWRTGNRSSIISFMTSCLPTKSLLSPAPTLPQSRSKADQAELPPELQPHFMLWEFCYSSYPTEKSVLVLEAGFALGMALTERGGGARGCAALQLFLLREHATRCLVIQLRIPFCSLILVRGFCILINDTRNLYICNKRLF